jgi:hypothetical protein
MGRRAVTDKPQRAPFGRIDVVAPDALRSRPAEKEEPRAAVTPQTTDQSAPQQREQPNGVGDLNVHRAIVMNLANADIVTLTEVQKAAIPPAIEGLDVIAKSHTGMCSVMMICDVVTCV